MTVRSPNRLKKRIYGHGRRAKGSHALLAPICRERLGASLGTSLWTDPTYSARDVKLNGYR